MMKEQNNDFAFFLYNFTKKKKLGISGPSKANTKDWDVFYKAFEKRFRGESDSIREILEKRYSQVFSEHITSNKSQYHKHLDLGCGHGEMLDISKKLGFRSIGIDVSQAAVQECIAKGHFATNSDLVVALKKTPDSSIDIVSYMHVIEHINPQINLTVFKEVYRVLKPGGRFLIETPSLLSLWASQRQFYLDPTHLQPIHPEYIEFMGHFVGFAQSSLKTFGTVEHNLRSDLSSNFESYKASSESEKLENWLYGDMDLCCILRK